MSIVGGTPIHASRLRPGLERRFKALQADVFQAQRLAFQARAADAALAEDLVGALVGAQRDTRGQQEKWFRRCYVTVGAAFARQGMPRVRNRREEPVPWGPSANPWWQDEYRPLLGDEPWWDAWLRAQLRYAERTMGSRITTMDAAGVRLVRREVLNGLQAGDGVPAIRDRIDDAMRNQWTTVRAERIARTEVPTAARSATYQAVQAAGLGAEATKSWQDSGDSRTRPEHEAATAQNQDVPYAEAFVVASSATGAPQRLLFPGDTSLGADASTVVQCRCDFFVDLHR